MEQKATHAMVGGICLIVGLVIGLGIGNSQRTVSAENITALEQEYTDALSRVRTNAPSSYQPDPSVTTGMKHAVEINEMLCKTRGINCEEAKLFRKQYEEMISGL